jgi:hypothetical protein
LALIGYQADESKSTNDAEEVISNTHENSTYSLKASMASLKREAMAIKRREVMATERTPLQPKTLECLTMDDLLERQELHLLTSKAKPVHPKWVVLK